MLFMGVNTSIIKCAGWCATMTEPKIRTFAGCFVQKNYLAARKAVDMNKALNTDIGQTSFEYFTKCVCPKIRNSLPKDINLDLKILFLYF